jgi:hypothetical protein
LFLTLLKTEKIMTRLFALLLFLVPVSLTAQQKSRPITLSFFNESTSIPFTRLVTTPVHPGLQVGTEFVYKRKKTGKFFQIANISYFFHQHLNHGIALSTEIGYEHRTCTGLSLSGLAGIGYLHTFATGEEYKLVDGEYKQHTDKGNARLYPSLSLGLGYYFRAKDPRSAQVFLRYQGWAEYPYSPGFIPVMTHTNLHLGLSFYIAKKTTKK